MNKDLLEKTVYAEQVEMLYSSMAAAVIANIVTSILFIAIQWQVIEKKVLLSWFVISLFIIVLRTILLFIYKRRSVERDEIKKWGMLFLAGSSASGLMLGSAGIFLFPAGNPIYQLACAFVLLGMCSGAVSSLSFGKYNFVLYATLTLVPLIISLALENTRLSLILIPMLILSLLFLLKSNNTIYKNTEQNILLRLQATEREKELLKSQQKYALHIQNTPLGVIEWDTDFKVTDWNASAEKIFGYKKEDVLGKNAHEFIVPEKIKDDIHNVWNNLLTLKGGTHSENINTTKYGNTITAEWFNTPLINEKGKVIGVTSLVQDISERKRMEEMKNEFVATVSHELRTPLTAIKGSLGLLLGGAAGTYTETASEMLQTANKNTDRLLLLINDILDMKKIEAGDFDFDLQDYTVISLIEESLETNKTYATQFDISFIISEQEGNEKVHVDKFRFLQIMSNLLSNAAKFSPRHDQVEIRVKKQDPIVRIEVKDNGDGVPKDFQDKIFDRFTQSNSSNTRSSGGTGLGLAITKILVEKFNGTIGLISKEGEGSTFFIELPLVKEPV